MKSLLAAFALLMTLAAVGTAQAQPFAYITNRSSNDVSVIETATNTVVATVAVGTNPAGVAVNAAGTRAYVANNGGSVSVIDTTTFTVVATVAVGATPNGVAVNPLGTRVYVTNFASNDVSVIDTTTNSVVATVPVGASPAGVAVDPTGTFAYITNQISNNVSVINTASNLVVNTVAVGAAPFGIAVNPVAKRAYVANTNSNSVSVIDTSTNLVVNTVTVGTSPLGVAVNVSGTFAYVANRDSSSVSVIDTSTNLVVNTVAVGTFPVAVAVNPSGTRAYVPNRSSNNVSVIDTASNLVVATVAVGIQPSASGLFVGGPSTTVPGAPTIGTVTAGVGSATVNYAAPAFNGGSVITSYTAKSNPGNITGSATSGPITVTGLTNGTAYTFTVTATNAVGTSPPSAASNSVTPSAPSATYAPTAGLDFGMRTAGVVSPLMQATFTNTSAVSLLVSSISFNGGGAGFNVLGSSQCLTPMLVLAPATSCTFDITSQPNALGVLTDSVFVLTAPANAAVPPALPLTVTGVAPSSVLAIVTNTADSGAGSLRQAITDANAGGFCAPTATINFNIPGGGLKVITPFSPLPTLLCPSTIIDGYSQSGASANTLGSGNNAIILVALDGAIMTPPAPGLALNGNNILVRGLNIRKFIGQPGIRIQGGAGVKIEGNFIGTDELGTTAVANGTGIDMSSGTFAVIGNTTPASRNVISGNTGNGIALTGASGPTGTQIRNNHIGTDKTGATPLANGGDGILLNVPNTEVDGNFIRYSLGHGVKIIGSGAGPANIHDNDILANTGNGIYLAPTECAVRGVFVQRNNIGFQSSLGIDLGDVLIATPPRDTNLVVNKCYHGNEGQNYPVITAVTHAWNGAVATSTVNATLNSAASTPYTIDLFNNLGAVDSGNRGVAAKYVSSLTTPATDAMGFVSFQLATTGAAVYHPTLTSTTPAGPSGGTSEISVQAVTPLVYTSTYSNFSIVAGGSQSQTFTFLNADAAAVVVPPPTSSSTAFTITSSTCGSVLPGGTCQVVVTYLRAVPTTTETATLTIGPITSASMPVLPVAVQPAVTYTWALTGVATAPLVAVSPTSLTFASTAQGTQSLPQTVTVTNADTAAITLGVPSASPAEFFIAATTCGASLPATSSCTITVKLSPFPTSTPGGTSGGLSLTAAASSLFVGLSGTVAVYAGTASPSPASFPNTTVLTNSAPQTVTFTNNSTGTVNIFTVDLTGTDAADFQVMSTSCAGIVASLATCTAAVRFSPLSLGAKTANVRFNSGGSSTLGILTGTSILAAPLITSPATAGGVTGSAFTYAITATNSPTSFGATGLPTGLSVNTSTGVISGTPSVTGTFSATITASNGGGSGTQALVITITAATVAPAITSAAPPVGTVGIAYTHSFTATGTTPMTWSIATGTLPAGLALNATSGLLSGTPTTAGSFAFTVQVANGTAPNATQNVTIVINPPAPVITSATTAGGVTGSAFTYSITATNTPTSFGATGLPAGLTVNTTTGVISGTPSVTGTFSATITASNGGGSGTQALVITITAATVAPAITSAAPPVGTVGIAYTHSFTATGTTPITWSIATGALPAGLTLNATSGILSGTPTTAGSFGFTVQAANGTAPNATQNVTIVINPPAPAITSPTTASGVAGSSFTHSITATNSPTSFGATGLPAGLTVNVSSGIISGTPSAAGTFSATITATNAGGTGTQALAITITAATVAPTITSTAPPAGTVGIAYSHSFTATGTTPITWSIATGALPAGLALNATSGLLSGTPMIASSFAFTIQAANGTAPNATQTNTIVINPATPVITSPATAGGVNGTAFTYQITATNTPTSFGATGLPTGLTVNTGTGVISGTPSVTGPFTATITATNAGGTGTQALTITITAATVAPTITSTAPPAGTVGIAYSHSFTATGTTPMTWSIATGTLSAGLALNATSGLLSGTPTTAGSFAFTVQVANRTAPNATQSVTIVINPSAPAITSPTTASGVAGSSFTYSITATNSPTSFGATGLPPGLTVNLGTGLISGTPSVTGTTTATVTATNGGGTATQTLTITITAATVGPTITSTAPPGGTVGIAYSHTFTASGATPMTWSIATGALPAGLTLNATSGILSGTPTTAGSFGFTVQAANGTAPNATQNVTISIAPPAPVITSAATANGITGNAFTYAIAATNTPTSFGATGLPAGLSVNAVTGVISGSPTVPGTFTATITATNAGGTGSKTLTITIVALAAPTIAFATAPTSITVGGTTVGTMTITNGNATPLTANPFTFFYLAGLVNAAVPNATSTCSGAAITATPGSGSYNQSTSFTIPASGSCTFSSTVTTGTVGTYTGSIPVGLIVTGAGSSAASNSVTLTVTAAPTPAVNLNPATVSFGSRTVNTTSPPTVVTLTNSGTGSLVINSINGSGNFGFTSACPILTPSLAAGAQCTINITFTPLTATAITGTITITSNAPGSPHTVALSGTGTAVPVPGISIAPAALTFAAQIVNTTSAAQNVTVTNTGFANLAISSITAAGPFSRATLSATASPPDCGSTLAPGSSCQIGVVFNPAGTGALTGVLTIADNAAGSPHTVALSGTGTPVPVAVINANSSITFGDQIINSTSGALNLTISNTGTATLTTSAITLTGPNAADFTLAGQSGCTTIAPARSCTLSITFNPASTGAKTAQVNITSNAQNSAAVNTVALTGNGILAPRSIVSFTATTVGFGDAIFGGATPNQIVTLTNTGGQALNIPGIAVTGDFVQTNNCGTSLAPLAICTINILFTPLGQGVRFGELILTTNAPTSPDRIQLSGTGCRWFSQAQSRFFLTSCG